MVGVDLDMDALDKARRRLDQALVCDVESDSGPVRFSGVIDVVAFCDVLEHLRVPRAVLRGMRPLISERGVVVASIPNVRQIRTIAKLMAGRWAYIPGPGTLQGDQVPFFTRGTIEGMFVEAGYEKPRFFFLAYRSKSFPTSRAALLSAGG